VKEAAFVAACAAAKIDLCLKIQTSTPNILIHKLLLSIYRQTNEI